MNESNRLSSAALLGAVLTWLCCGASSPAPVHGQTGPPPEGAGIVAWLHSDQDAYANKPDTVWCPPCVYENPPCMLPCYFVDGAAVAQFTFQVTNQYKTPRTFQFSSGQQFDVEIIDQTGSVVAAWSDGQMFTDAGTSFTLGPGQTQTFTIDMSLRGRDGKQLKGTYDVRAFLTTSGPQPQVQAGTQIVVTVAS